MRCLTQRQRRAAVDQQGGITAVVIEPTLWERVVADPHRSTFPKGHPAVLGGPEALRHYSNSPNEVLNEAQSAGTAQACATLR
jgi:hypothetical protein